MPWTPPVIASTSPDFTPPTIAANGAQFLTLGPFGTDYARFTLQVNEMEPIILTESSAYYPLLNDTPARQP